MRLTLTILFISCCAGPAAAQVDVSTPAATVEQVYKPVSMRDPLLPSGVFGDQKGVNARPGAAAAKAVEKGTFSVYGLTLTGIMEDSSGRQALLRDAAGAVYTLKAGRLTDARKKAVPGVSGVVKGKQVVLMTEDKKVHQLNLREKD